MQANLIGLCFKETDLAVFGALVLFLRLKNSLDVGDAYRVRRE